MRCHDPRDDCEAEASAARAGVIGATQALHEDVQPLRRQSVATVPYSQFPRLIGADHDRDALLRHAKGVLDQVAQGRRHGLASSQDNVLPFATQLDGLAVRKGRGRQLGYHVARHFYQIDRGGWEMRCLLGIDLCKQHELVDQPPHGRNVEAQLRCLCALQPVQLEREQSQRCTQFMSDICGKSLVQCCRIVNARQ